jgi:hypothetical protein
MNLHAPVTVRPFAVLLLMLLGFNFGTVVRSNEPQPSVRTQSQLVAQEILLVDSAGRTLARFGADQSGNAAIHFINRGDQVSMAIGQNLDPGRSFAELTDYPSFSGMWLTNSRDTDSKDQYYEGDFIALGLFQDGCQLTLASQSIQNDNPTGTSSELSAGREAIFDLNSSGEDGWRGVQLGHLQEAKGFGVSVHSDLSLAALLDSPPSLSLARGEARKRVFTLDYSEAPRFRWVGASSGERAQDVFE